MCLSQILVVEDEKIVALDIRERLIKLGYDVAGLATTGLDAIAAATELQPDLILMDIKLKGAMDGITAAEQIRADLNLPVIYLTAYADNPTLQRAKITEPNGYLLKPFEDRELHTAIEMALYKHRMEKRLRQSERWLAATLHSIGDAVVATDAQGRIEFINPVAEKLTGWTQLEALGQDAAAIFHVVDEQTSEATETPVRQVLRQGQITTLTNHRLITRTGTEIPIDDSAAPIIDDAGQIVGVVLVFRDITEKRAIQEQLIQQKRLALAGQLAGGIAHNFNNMLTGIIGFAELTSFQPNLPASAKKNLAGIIKEGQRAAHLVRQILDFSRTSEINKRPLPLAAFLDDTASLLRHTLPTSINFVLNIESDTIEYLVDADAAQLQQALTNLTGNALDAMPAGGTLEFRLSLVTFEPEQPRPCHGMSAGVWLALAVSDTGTGISPEHRPHIFEPFFTTKTVGKGVGMGLAQVYGIAKHHAGDIHVDSQTGQGATFTLYLPAQPRPSPTTAVLPADIPAGHAELLLLVDPNISVLEIGQITLGQLGYRVLTASTRQEALALFKQQSEIALILADIIAPELNGPALRRKLRRINPAVKIVALSSYPPITGADDAYAQDIVAWVQKPWRLDQLAQTINQVLAE